MLLSVFFALMVGSDAKGGTGQGGASPATSASSAEVVQDQRAADMITEAVDQVRSDWKKWAAGPYRVLLQSEAYKMNVAEWEIGMHEWLAVEDVSDEMLQQFMDTVGGDFTDKADLIRAMGVYRAGHSLSRSPHGTTSRRSPPAGATGPGAGWCSWPFAASCTSGGWATRPASRGSGYQCRGSLHSGTKSATRKSPHTPSRLFSRHGGHISGNTDLDTCKYDSRWSPEEGRCYKRCSSKWCNIGTSQKLPGTASRSWGPCPGGIKAESCEGCKSGAAGGHRPSPDITARMVTTSRSPRAMAGGEQRMVGQRCGGATGPT